MILIYDKASRTWSKNGSAWDGKLNCDHFILMSGTKIVNVKKVVDQPALFVLDTDMAMTSFPYSSTAERDAIIVKQMRKLEQ